MSKGAYLRIATQTREQFRSGIAGYRRDSNYFKAIFYGCGFGRRFARRSEMRVLDAMCGPGRLGTDLAITARERGVKADLRISFTDINGIPLAGLAGEGFETVCSDIRGIHSALGESEGGFDLVVVRNGLKSLPKGELRGALESLRETLVKGGRIVIGDLTSFNEEAQGGITRIQSAKQEFAGRNPELEGVCFVPTFDQWRSEVSGAGFNFISLESAWGEIEINQWRGQFGVPPEREDEIIRGMGEIIRETARNNKKFTSEAKVQFEGELVRLSFPLAVVTAERG